ncbi:basic amino acid ABC transporter substrate-binding protein [Brachyspira innocens]|uniref:Basic amino acid ABC transporter substrate-binding protein n=1 Tax=Brachyspira innocens TaxID=13264 RepID=A0ABT8YX21_9SPIR|nr:basic amino acid ABC transporter substrate-binding protein [Brachyspira innocens]MDO6992416.1 basic amino acid ABC transporter substrate-binding protein [Brachyspira innocens]MDO7019445.1 basic amino acid ABC transporter substrate-binding protein [Brachyspira innocens]
MFKNNIFKIIIALSIILTIFIGCQKKEDKNKLYVGTNAEFEPFEYREGDNIVGFDIDLINEIAKLIGAEIEVVDMQFDGLLPALEAKKIDLIIAGMTATEERKQFVNFSEPYYNSKQSIVVLSNNTDITTFDNFAGKKVGVVLGYTGDILVSEMTNVEVQKFNATSETILALKSQKVDAVVLDYEPAKNYVAQNKELKLIETDSATEEYSIAMRKDDTELLTKVNDALKTINENGTYETLLGKYFEN